MAAVESTLRIKTLAAVLVKDAIITVLVSEAFEISLYAVLNNVSIMSKGVVTSV